MSLENYEIITTGDGSPSLVFKTTDEAMHNLIGALSESLEIYYSAMAHCLQEFGDISVASVGLGLGYNELLFAALCLNNNIQGKVRSFEADCFLQNSWNQWLQGQRNDLTELHNEIAKQIANEFKLRESDLKKYLKDFVVEGELTKKTKFTEKYNCIIYDPFSAKTNENMWKNTETIDHLSNNASTQCLFTTYAAKGDLTRRLKSLGFKVELKNGFGGKRHRTWAIRYEAIACHNQ